MGSVPVPNHVALTGSGFRFDNNGPSDEDSLSDMDVDELVKWACELPHETEWVEFKLNDDRHEEIGEYISAIANSAALFERDKGFIIWGIEDERHAVRGTTFLPREYRVGGEELENWLSTHLTPRVHFIINEGHCEGQPVIVFEVPAASHTPVRFRDTAFIRVGSYKKKLKEHPEKEKALWQILNRKAFESGIALSSQTAADVFSVIDYPAYFDLTSQQLPDNHEGILQRLVAEGIVQLADALGKFDVTNMGAVLFAKSLGRFPHLARKAIRVIVYKGRNRVATLREQEGTRGYASGFEGLIGFIDAQLPRNELIGQALRTESMMYPAIAVRELVANALIHQDFNFVGSGPMIEIFQERIEITNPGTPLIDTQRFIDAPPRSRNDRLAALMRRMNICEERGSGVDKVISSVEVFQLPAPAFSATEEHTRVTLFAPRPFSAMDRDDRIRACYQHACLRYVSNDRMTNTSLRARFGIADKNYSIASRVIADTLKAKLIKKEDPRSTSKKHSKYVPFWA